MRTRSPLLGTARLLAYVLWTCALIPVQILAVALKRPLARTLPRFYHGVCRRIMGIDTVVCGTVSAERPTLFVCNHTSYLDIMVLGSLVEACFVAKSEVALWPFFGLLAKLQRTVFVDRRIGSVGGHRDILQRRLTDGDCLILFPEGTSSDGTRTLPFKSALFAVAGLRIADRPICVQPVSITCTALDGMPLGRRLRPVYAWYGDMELVPHLWAMAGFGRLTVTVEFHPPVTFEHAGSRKALAAHCWGAVSAGVANANAGHAPTGEAPPGAPRPSTYSLDFRVDWPNVIGAGRVDRPTTTKSGG
ncbi:MAG: lysophospholipid acyltransferase family protein [Alphaproteobacteria bacterium]